MHNFHSLPSKIARDKRTERGLSLVELLVAMIIFAVIAAATVSIIVMLNNSTAKFENTTTTQNELNIAMNTIQRDISQATSVSDAGKYSIGLNSVQKDVGYKTYIFFYDGTVDNLPDGANTSNLPKSTPNRGAIIEQTISGTTLQSQKVLVSGYQPSSSWNSFFQYYTQNGSQLGASGATLTATQLGTIARVQFSLQSKVTDRTTPVELASSATVNSYQAGVNCTDCDPVVPNPPTMHGRLTYESQATEANAFDGWVQANLTWNQPGGTDSYTIYRYHNGVKERSFDVAPSEVTHYEDRDALVYGETYVYKIQANGPSGLSSEGNPVSLTVRPPRTNIVNINTKANLTQVKNGSGAESGTTNPYGGTTYTVARDLTNQITWAPSNGAVGYRLYRDGALLSTLNGNGSTSYKDAYSVSNPSITYGATHTYYVIPYDLPSNPDPGADGGDGIKTGNVQLIGPPTAPHIVTTAYPGTTGTPYNTITVDSPGVAGPAGVTVTGNHLYAVSVNSGGTLPNCPSVTRQGGNDFAPSGSTNHTVGFGTATCYAAKAYNDAGESPFSNTNIDEVHPGAFQITNINTKAGLTDTANGYRYTVARNLTNQVSWTNSDGANGYKIYRNDVYLGTLGGGTTSWQDTDGNYVNYGRVNTYRVVAIATWGNDELDTAATNNPVTLVSPPVAPRITGTEYGDSSGNPYNTVTLAQGVANATGYQLLRNTSTTNVGDCNNTSYTGQDFYNQGDQRNDGVDWGSSTCYVALSYNDAGFGLASSGIVLYVGPADFAIQNYTTNRDAFDQPINGLYYTVARDTTNQVSWNNAPGADGYDTYRNGSYAFNVGNVIRMRDGRNFGDQTGYRIRAYANWSGSNRVIYRDSVNSINLDSAPLAPSIAAVANDDGNTTSTSSRNTVSITGTPGGSPAIYYNVYANSSSNASTNCNNNSDIGYIGLPVGSTKRNNVNWGTSSCYYVQPSNYAGNGPASNQVGADQAPGYFNFTTLDDNTKFLLISSSKTSTTSCVGDVDNVDYCYNGNKNPTAQIENANSGATVDSTHLRVSIPLSYEINWSGAYGAGNSASDGNAYDLIWAAANCNKDIPGRNGDNRHYNTSTTAVDTGIVTPGCLYNVNVTARANNNRTRSVDSQFIVAPTVAASGDNYVLTKSGSSNTVRRLQSLQQTVKYGTNSTGNGLSMTFANQTGWWDGNSLAGDQTTTANYDSGSFNSWSDPGDQNTRGSRMPSRSYSSNTLNWSGHSGEDSLKINFTGAVSSDNCVVATNYGSCASSWGLTVNSPNQAAFWPEKQYTDKFHPNYGPLDY